MDQVRAVTVAVQGASGPVAALQADARAVVAQVADNTGLSEGERVALVAATVDIDQFISAQPARSDALAQVVGLGTYLRSTSTKSIPRWNVMTALRAYGLNLTEDYAAPKAKPVQAEAVQQVRAKLEHVARASRDVSLDTAVAAAKAAPVVAKAAPVKVESAPKVAPKVDAVV